GRLPPPHTRTCHAGTPSLPFSRVRSPRPPLWPSPCTWLVIAPRARPCVEHSCQNPRCLRLRGRHQRTLKLCRRSIVQCRVQTLFVVDLLQELADGSTSMHQIPIFSSVYLFIFESLHERLARGIFPRVRLATHTD